MMSSKKQHFFLSVSMTLCGILHAYNSTISNKYQLTDEDITQKIIEKVSAEHIRDSLRYLSAKPHLASTARENSLAEYVRDTWQKQGLNNVKLDKYEVLLSFPDWSQPNQVNVVSEDSNCTIVFAAAGRQKPLYAPEEFDNTAIPTFNAYSKYGTAEGQPVYVNYGRQEDFDWIVQNGIDLKGKILIARYGKSARTNIAKKAEDYKASAVILFTDPINFAPEGRENVYPKTTWLPGTGAESGSITRVIGDPLTPNYPSIDGAYRIDIEEANLPKIITQPICYNDAEQILKLLGGIYPPADWVGALNATYQVGPGFSNSKLKLKVNVKTKSEKAVITNVIASIRGTEEPDRYIILGNHRDAWVHGASDPCSGMAVLLEVTRVFSELLKEGWRPKRSIIVASWDGEEASLIGSSEWVEKNMKILKDRAVAYLNVDTAVGGNYALKARGVPSLYRVMYESSKKIPNPDPQETTQGRLSMYDTWLFRRPDNDSPISNQTLPKIHKLGSASDFAAFIQKAGVPSLEYRHLPKDLAVSPLYHTLYDTFFNLEMNVDPGFKIHTAMAQLWTETARSLIDAHVLPLNMIDYANYLQSQFTDFTNRHGQELSGHNITLEYFKKAVEQFGTAAYEFNQSLESHLNKNNPIAIRAANDKLMQVEKAFTQPEGLPTMRHMNHVIFAPSSLNALSDAAFSPLRDMIFQAQTKQDWKAIKRQLAATVYYINSAISILFHDDI